jgi:hypothetical protein
MLKHTRLQVMAAVALGGLLGYRRRRANSTSSIKSTNPQQRHLSIPFLFPRRSLGTRRRRGNPAAQQSDQRLVAAVAPAGSPARGCPFGH